MSNPAPEERARRIDLGDGTYCCDRATLLADGVRLCHSHLQIADAIRAAEADARLREPVSAEEALAELRALLADMAAYQPQILTYDPPAAAAERVRQVVERLRAGQSPGSSVIPPSQATFTTTSPAVNAFHYLERLCDLLALHPQERAFLRHLAENRLDGDTAAVFADWLRENGRDDAGNRVEALRPQPGDMLVMWPATGHHTERDDLEEACRLLAERWGFRCLVLSDPGQKIESLSTGRMRQLGWVRDEEADRRVAEAWRSEEYVHLGEGQGEIAVPLSGGEIAGLIRNRKGQTT